MTYHTFTKVTALTAEGPLPLSSATFMF